jgi:hypothetical protein
MRLGLDPFVPQCCSCCRKTPSQGPCDHASGCSSAMHKLVGTTVERAVEDALRVMQVPIRKTSPRIDDHPNFKLIAPAREDDGRKKMADQLVLITDQLHLTDQSFRTRVHKPTAKMDAMQHAHQANQIEVDKRKQYRHWDFPPHLLIPMGFHSRGAWGDSATMVMEGLYERMHDQKPEEAGWRANLARKLIGKGICRANHLYLNHFRNSKRVEEDLDGKVSGKRSRTPNKRFQESG